MAKVKSVPGRLVPTEEVARAKLWDALRYLVFKVTELLDVVIEQERDK